MSNIKLIKLIPLDTRTSGHGIERYPAIVWYRRLKISNRLDQDAIDRIIKDLKTQEKIESLCNPDNLLYWQYPKVKDRPRRPMIIFDKRTDPITVCTTDGTIEHFGLLECQRQAGIVLQILQKYNYASFRRVTLSTFRLGDSSEERKRNLKMLEEILQSWKKK